MTLRYTRKSNRTKKIEARGEKNAHSTHKVDTTDKDIHPAELKRNLVEKKNKAYFGEGKTRDHEHNERRYYPCMGSCRQ